MKDLYKTADWKSEKHVPVIEAPAAVAAGKAATVTVSVGKEIAHPNTTEHHICWIELYFQPEGGKVPYQLGRFTFDAHGASAEGPNTSTVLTKPCVVCSFSTEKAGTLHAASYCNIHGLWESSAAIALA